MRRRVQHLALAAAGALVLAVPGVASAATPVDNGCPAAGAPISVAALEAAGDYRVPRRIDDPANGGNGDGWICAFPLPGAVATAWGEDGFQIYMFFENNLAAQGRP